MIRAHAGLGRVIAPVHTQASVGSTKRSVSQFDIVDAIIRDPRLDHVYFDISWTEMAKYAVRDADAIEQTSRTRNLHADRILFGTDNVAPTDQARHLEVYRMWDPVWEKLDPEASRKIRTGNFERLFDQARASVREWESGNVGTD